ncbi:MAG: acetate--CoA ligase family protein [Acidobacteriota bacterium]
MAFGRKKVPMNTSVESMLRPRSIAVIGASEKSFVGSIVVRNLQTLGYGGRIFPVNPKYDKIHGLRCYPSIEEIPHPVEAAVIALGARHTVPMLRQLAAKGVKGVTIPAGGFADTGTLGKALQEELVEICREHNMAVCGPNGMGFVNLVDGAAMYIGTLSKTLLGGNVGAILQSGSICEALANHGDRVGFSYLISSGNEAVTDLAEYVRFLVRDPSTRVIAAFIEGFRDPEGFVLAAEEAAEAGKPIVALKVGRGGRARQLALAHTGALVGSDDVQDALFRQKGIIRVHDLDELLESVALFSQGRLPRSRRVVAITFSGGEAGSLADIGEAQGLEFPELSPQTRARLSNAYPDLHNRGNPLDCWGVGRYDEVIPLCMEALAADPGYDTFCVSIDLPFGHGERESEVAQCIARKTVDVAAESDKIFLFSTNISGPYDRKPFEILKHAELPVLLGMRNTMLAVRHLAWYAEFQARRRREGSRIEPKPLKGIRAAEARTIFERSREAVVGEREGKAILSAYGIPVPAEALAHDADEAVAYARKIGAAVVLKIDSPQISHKTEAGGVRLRLEAPEEIRAAFGEIVASALRYQPDAQIRGVLVQEMVPPGTEMIAGLKRDPQFGMTMVVGLGGIFVEVMKDAALRVLPVDQSEVEEMIASLRSRALLEGARGRPRGDVPALVEALLRLSKLASDLGPRIDQLDINPLIVLPEGKGVRAVDALIVKREENGSET